MINKKDTHKIEIDVKNRLVTVDGYETAFAYPVIANHERIDVYFDIPMYYKSKLLYEQKVDILKSISIFEYINIMLAHNYQFMWDIPSFYVDDTTRILPDCERLISVHIDEKIKNYLKINDAAC